MIDVHYYLTSWIPMNRKRCDWFNAVGGNFFPAPGEYALPFNEGRYIIDGQSNVSFNARRSGTWYRHPLVGLVDPVSTINFGWYSIAQSSGNPCDFKLFKYAPTGYNTGNSLQSTWITDKMENLKGT